MAVVKGNPTAFRHLTGAQLCLFPTTDYCALILPYENRDSLTRQMRELAPDCVWSLSGASGRVSACECEGILRKLWRINVARNLPEDERLRLLHRLTATAYHACAVGAKTSDRAPITCMDRVLACERADEKTFGLLLELYRTVARACGAIQRECSCSLIDAVREYIELNYADSNLSLDSVAKS